MFNPTKEEILAILPKPSDAVNAMIVGLEEWKANPKCEIRMCTFGDNDNDICFGCAATSTIAHAFKLKPEIAVDVWKNSDGHTAITLFESIIDSLRKGSVYKLFQFYNLDNPEPYPNIPYLHDSYTQQDMKYYIEYKDYLITQGL